MKNTFGTAVSLTLFGESHGAAVGAVIDGLAPGIEIDDGFIRSRLLKRKGENALSTKRREKDEYKIVSGVFGGKTTGTPICIIIENADTKSGDYEKTAGLARPGHADFTAEMKYHGFQDYRGGGHFSGRLTAAVVAAGAIAQSALMKKGIMILTHISKLHNVCDRGFEDYEKDFNILENKLLPMLDSQSEQQARQAVIEAARCADSVGGILETHIVSPPAGVGEPWFDSVESVISHAVFGIPAVKGIEFGAGFSLSDMYGSQANDSFFVDLDGTVKTKTNNNGGINGGITNGMPITFKTVIKPTASIYKKQQTVDMTKNENAQLQIHGRHDPAIIARAAVVIDSVAALCMCDLLSGRFGTDWLGGEAR